MSKVPAGKERRRALEDVLAENELLREEIRTAREAAEISANLVARQFEETEALLQRLKTANDRLEAERGHLQFLLDTAPVGVVISVDGIIRFANQQVTENNDLDIGGSAADFYVNPEERDAVVSQLMIGAEIKDVDIEMYGRGRNIRNVAASFSPIEYEGKLGTLAWLVDVTERKQARDALTVEKRHLAAILDGLPDATFVIDCDGIVTAWNRAAEELTGVKAEEIIGKGDYEYGMAFYDERRPILIDLVFLPQEQVLTRYSHVRRVGDALMGEGRMRKRKDGSYIWFEGSAALLRDAGGNVVGAVETVRDMTERKMAELASDRARQQSAAILDGLPDAAFVVDSENKVIAWNRALADMTGYDATEMLGKGKGDYGVPFYGEQRPILVDHLGLSDEEISRSYPVLRHEGDVLSGEAVIHVPAGDLYIEARACVLRDAAGEVIGGIEIIRDLNERKKFENELADARELAEAASTAKSDFLANMSHEIRTPMNAIIGMTHLALETGLTARQRGYLEKVDAAAKGLLGIINDILDFSKIEAGKISFEKIPFDLDEVLDNLADLSAIKAQDKGLELLFDVGTDVPTALVGDPLRLGQVLTNLVSNAIKFTEEGEITVGIHRIDDDEHGVRLQFTVHDTGIGLTKEQCSRLFSAFSQADSSTTRKYGGTGLGLSISKRLVEMMAGEIVVESEPNVGSSFIFTATFGLDDEIPSLSDVAIHLPGLRVLVVDDNATARDIFLAMLGSLRFEANAVDGASAALEELEQAQRDGRPYGLVLMDWRMSPIDGVEAVRRIQADERLTDTPMCMMGTAYSRDELQQRLDAERVRVDGILAKPVSPSTLCDSIMKIFGKDIGRRLRRQQRQAGYQEAQEALRGARILLVEDNEMNRELALEILGTAGIQIEAAVNGAEALQELEKEKFDAVLMDCQMPVMDGFEATRRLRAAGRTLPVIAMTANAMAEDREKCLACGMNDHIAKPIDVSQLFSTLARWVKPEAIATAAPGDEPADVAIPTIDGLDSAAALARVAGNAGLYIKMLKWFRDGQLDTVANIRGALKLGDFEDAQRQAHTLKGLAGNIGASQLSEAATELERQLKFNPNDVSEEMLDAVKRPLAALVAAIDDALPNGGDGTSPVSAGPVDIEVLALRLQEFAQLLAEDDAEATEYLEPIAALLKDDEAWDEFRHLAQLTEGYAFDEALSSLDQLAARLGISLA